MTFKYTGYDPSGKKIQGTTQADSVKSALEQLRKTGILVTEIKEKSSIGSSKTSTIGVQRGKRSFFRLSLKELVLFSRQLETMISSGVRLVDALDTLSQQEVFSKRFRKIIANVSQTVKSGKSFSEALEQEGVFESVFINMVKAGEEGGVLDTTLKKLANYYESTNRLTEQIKSSMTYPVFILGFAVAVVFIISVFILPRLISVFGNVPQGGLFGFLMTLNFIFTQRAYIAIPVILAIVGGFYFFSKTSYFVVVKDLLANLFPPVRKLREKMSVERFTRTLGVLVSSGVPMVTALTMAAKASNYLKFEKVIMNVVEDVKAGSNLKTALKKTGIFPQIVYEMVGTGEDTGKLDVVMEKVADFFEDEVVQGTKKLVSLMEPMMIAFVGLFIAFIAYSMYTVIFSAQGSFMR